MKRGTVSPKLHLRETPKIEKETAKIWLCKFVWQNLNFVIFLVFYRKPFNASSKERRNLQKEIYTNILVKCFFWLFKHCSKLRLKETPKTSKKLKAKKIKTILYFFKKFHTCLKNLSIWHKIVCADFLPCWILNPGDICDVRQ